MFYDPNTKLFLGDGDPRPTPARADGTTPCAPNHAVEQQAQQPRSDILHVQKRSFVKKALKKFGMEDSVHEYRFCRCTNRWHRSRELVDHVCEVGEVDVRVKGGRLTREDVTGVDWVQQEIEARGHESSAVSQKPDGQLRRHRSVDNLEGTTGVGEANGSGNGDTLAVHVHDSTEHFTDVAGQRVFAGTIVRDFGIKDGQGQSAVELK